MFGHRSIQSRQKRWIVSICATGRKRGIAVQFEANSRQFRGNLSLNRPATGRSLT
ncbi:hypothetical protein Z947_3006 [Sulfitobacter geojensis]|nr:hypothetical protein Z947_3006 [Sulfitobacter geojensis]